MMNLLSDPANRAIPAGRSVTEWWKIVLPVGLVCLSLITIIVILATIGRKSRELRTELAEVFGPATGSLSDLQRVLALQLAARQHWFGDPSRSFPSYGALRAEESAVYERLHPLVRALGSDAASALEQLRVSADRWHDAVELTPTPEADTSGVQAEYNAVLSSVDRLSFLINRAAAARRATIAARERLEDRLIIAMVLLAAICLSVLFRVGHRLHHLTAEATHLARVSHQHEEELERVGREKAVFVRGITHDLKNPIGAIDAYAELLEIGVRGNLAPQQKEMVNRIRRCARQSLAIITDLLELAKAESGVLSIESEKVDLNHLAADVVEDYRATLESRGSSIELAPSPEHPRVITDAARVREILGNLLMNAAKHTPPDGHIVVEVAAPGNSVDSSDAVTVTVSDNGPGVPDHMRRRVFEEFARGPQSDGSGIGLAISRKIAHALGGDLVLADAEHGGASFALVLPHSRRDQSLEPKLTANRSRNASTS